MNLTKFYRLLFLLLYYCYSTANATNPVTLTFPDINSAAKYSGILWTVNGDNPVAKISYKFETLSISGNVFTVKLYDSTNEYLKVSTFIDEENKQPKLHVDYFVNTDNNNLLTFTLPDDTSIEGEISIDVKNQKVTVTNRSGELTNLLFGDLSGKAINLDLTIGAAEDRNSILGCVSVFDINLSGSSVDISKLKYDVISGQVKDGCNQCGDHSCHLGQCITINDKFHCDCRGAGKTGSDCSQDVSSVQLDGDTYLAYNVSRNQQTNVIEFSFKTQSTDGFLMSTSLSKKLGQLGLFLDKAVVFLVLGDNNFEITGIDLTSTKFHTAKVVIDSKPKLINAVIDGQTTTAKLADGTSETDLQLQSPIIFGTNVDLSLKQKVVACFREVFVDDLDVVSEYEKKNPNVYSNVKLNQCPKATTGNKNSPRVPLEGVIESSCNSKGTCKNAEKCDFDGTKLKCVCKKGFIGRYCEFSVYPRSCHDIWESGHTTNGRYLIDIDGSGILEPTEVLCKDGVTIVEHNVPDGTALKSNDNLRAKINYRFFDKEHQQFLRDNSENCDQLFTYNCDHAPLNLAENKTWFTSIDGVDFTDFIAELSSCKNGKCKCDSAKSSMDQGFLPKEYIPISAIHSVGCAKCNGHVTLGPFSCNGTNGRTKPYMVTFTDKNAFLTFGQWHKTAISLEFRTYSKKVTLISVNDKQFELNVDEKHLALNSLSSGTAEIISLDAMNNLTDGNWHRVILEVYQNNIRLSADEVTAVIESDILSNLEEAILSTGGSNGFLGCLRRVKIDGQLVNFEQMLNSGDEHGAVELGCENKCTFHQCHNDGKCIQDFENRKAYCSCNNQYTDSGEFCEISVNTDSDISLTNETHGVLKILNNGNKPLVSDYLFSFKTNKRDGMLLFVHDTSNNFIQVHLSDHINIILTINIKNYVYSCKVIADVGQEYSRMRWAQVMVLQQKDQTVLSVDGKTCTIGGERILLTNESSMFILQDSVEDVVKPPSGAFGIASNYSMSLTFIGGFPKTTDDATKYELAPLYISDIDKFVGCIRGFVVGTQILNLRNQSIWMQSSSGSIRVGCNAECEALESNCMNKGFCVSKWRPQTAKCDCAGTSYSGTYCDQDIGSSFNGATAITVNLKSYLVNSEYLPQTDHILSFAFSNSRNSNAKQVLAIVLFNDNGRMEVMQLPNGLINVIVKAEQKEYSESYEMSADERNFFHVRRNRRGTLLVTVNSVRKLFPTKGIKSLSFATVERFIFAGIPLSYYENSVISEIINENSEISNYTGCMSNIKIDFGLENLKFKPIEVAKNSAEPMSESFVMVYGDPIAFGQCAAFPGAKPAFDIVPVAASEWDVPLVLDTFVVPTLKPVADKPTSSSPTGDVGQSTSWWIIVIILLVILLLIILLIIMFLRIKRRRQESANKKRDPSLSGKPTNDTRIPIQSEAIPLVPPETMSAENEPPTSPMSPTKIRNDFNLPEADTPLNPEFPLPRPQEGSSGASTYVERKAPLAHTNETNRLSTPPYNTSSPPS